MNRRRDMNNLLQKSQGFLMNRLIQCFKMSHKSQTIDRMMIIQQLKLFILSKYNETCK
jgi:hypothetical protein